MADTIKIGNLDISSFKVGSSDCKVYLGDTLLYPSSPTPPGPTPIYQWKQYNEGDTVPTSLVYGVKLYTSLNYDCSIDFSVDGDTGVAFSYDYASDEWSAIDFPSYDPIDISGYFDGDNCYTILFSDIGYGGMPVSYPMTGEQFEFDVQLYEEAPQWITFSNGDTIPSDLDVYGVSGISQDLLDTYGSSNLNVQFSRSRNQVEYYIYDSGGSTCGSGFEYYTDPMEIIFSEVSCIDYFNQGATVSGTIQLLIIP